MNSSIPTGRPASQSTREIYDSLVAALPFRATESQERALVILCRFMVSEKERCAMILSGYAGTGKTSLMRSMVTVLRQKRHKSVLMAPTGRAAKVLSSYTAKPAMTIHKTIYRRMVDSSGALKFALKENRWRRCLFIVDEASMIGGAELLGRSLLSDLMEFVYNGQGCRLLLIGDAAQLPPVHTDESPALDMEGLRADYDLLIARADMTEVVRQEAGSGILQLATALRKRINGDQGPLAGLDMDKLPDVLCITGQEMSEALENEYDKVGIDQVKVICRSNRNANDYNNHIRSRVLYLEEELAAGDQLMIVKNNYHWMGEDSEAGFIANGDIAEVEYVKGERELYDLRFATVGLKFIDHRVQTSLECNVILDVLNEKGPSLSKEKMTEFYFAVRADHEHLGSRSKIREAMRTDEWYNALQVKYGNAITCHKSQGGQWPVIFIDRGYVTEEMIDTAYWRWLYTAVTRASQRLYLVNFRP